MSAMLFFVLIIGVLGPLYLWIGLRASSTIDSSDDYFLMGRRLSFFPLTLTLLATQLGGGTLLGAAQEAYSKGWIVLLFPLGTSLGLLLLACGIGGKLRLLGISTIAEIFDKIYGSKRLRYFASLLSIVSLFLILVAQGIASRKFFIAIGYDGPFLFSAFWCVLVAYTVMGGFKAVVDTDVVQCLFIIGALALAFFVHSDNPVEITQTVLNADIPWSSWLLLPMLFMFIEQDMAQRCFAAKRAGTIQYAAIASAIVLMLGSSVAIYFGIKAASSGIPIENGSSVLIASVSYFCHPIVANVFMAAILMAIISTADSLLCSISSNVVCDFLLSDSKESKRNIRLCRLITLSIGIGALLLCYVFNNVVTLLLLSYEISVCMLAVPILAAMWKTKPNRQAAIASMICGGGSFIILRVIPVSMNHEVLALVLSCAGYIIGELVFKQKEDRIDPMLAKQQL